MVLIDTIGGQTVKLDFKNILGGRIRLYGGPRMDPSGSSNIFFILLQTNLTPVELVYMEVEEWIQVDPQFF